MARYVKSGPCLNCGSSDAKALYDDGGSFCFSCRKPGGATITPYALAREETDDTIKLPFDFCQEFHKDAVDWVGKYGLTVADLLNSNNRCGYSAERHQLIYYWEDDKHNILAYQARNLGNVDKKKRYFTKGDIESLLPIYSYYPRCNSLVLVEDCLSAIKCMSPLTGLQRDAMPLLGSGISLRKLARLRPFYDVLYVFLDPNMFKNSVSIANQAQMLGFKTHVVHTDKDPKECQYLELADLLK